MFGCLVVWLFGFFVFVLILLIEKHIKKRKREKKKKKEKKTKAKTKIKTKRKKKIQNLSQNISLVKTTTKEKKYKDNNLNQFLSPSRQQPFEFSKDWEKKKKP